MMKNIKWIFNKNLKNFSQVKGLINNSIIKKSFNVSESSTNKIIKVFDNNTITEKINLIKPEILESLGLTNNLLLKMDYPYYLKKQAIFYNIPLFCKYQENLFKNISKFSKNYIFDYKYCNSFILNTIIFFIITDKISNLTASSYLIKNLIIYVKDIIINTFLYAINESLDSKLNK